MEFNEEEYLKILISDGEESVSFFSSKRKPERERLICAAFLKCLGVEFSEDEIKSSPNDPPDVIFRLASFEVREILDENRRRHDEFKKKLNNVRNAKNMKDIMKFESYSSNPITYSEIINLITDKLDQKSKKYDPKILKDIDALVYVNLEKRFLDLSSDSFNVDKLSVQGWRSVSMIMNGKYSHVFHATVSAPEFIKKFLSQTKSECDDPWI